MTDKMKNILIGLFVVASVTIAISMILFLEPKIGDGKKILRVRFGNISGIVIGTRVTFAGKPIGEVIHIREVVEARTHPDEGGRIYCYELILQTDSSLEVYDTDEIALRSTGLMGERSIAILPRAVGAPRLVTDEIIYANSADPLENTLNQIVKTAARLDGAIARCDGWFAENSTPLSAALQALQSFASRADHALSVIDKQELIPVLKESADLLNDNLRHIRSSLCDDRLLHKIASLAERLDEAARLFALDGAPMLKDFKQLAHDLTEGTGTVGRLIAKDDLYLHMSSLISKAETLMNDINHYGILFQYDKHWQRSRTKKANFLKALDTPKQFRTYFESEIDAMTASLGRLSELLERAENTENRDKISDNDHFKKQFSVLLGHAQSLTDSIKLYNEGLCAKEDALLEETH